MFVFYLGSFHVVIHTQQAITSILQQSNSKRLGKWGVTKGRHCTEECRRLTSTTALPFSPWKQTSLLVFVLMRHILISFTSVESLKVRFLKEAVLSLQPVQALFILNGREHIPLLLGWGGVAVRKKSDEREAVTFCELSMSFFLMLKMTWNRSLRSITRGSACVATNHKPIDT